MGHKHWFIFDSPVVLRTFSAIFSPATTSFCIWLWKIKLTTIPFFCKLQMQIVQRCLSDQDIDFFWLQRRGGISYNKTDKKALYVRMLGRLDIGSLNYYLLSISGMFVEKFGFWVCHIFVIFCWEGWSRVNLLFIVIIYVNYCPNFLPSAWIC